MKAVRIPNGIIHLSESKAKCPYCDRHIPIDDVEDKWFKSDRMTMRMKCLCKRFIGITTNMIGDFVAYELPNSKWN